MSSHAGGWAPGSLPPAGPVSRPKSSLRVGQRARKLGTANQTGVIRYVDTTGDLNGRRYFVCSHRGQKVGKAASFVRESELFVSDHMTRTEDTPLVVRPGEDVYDWSVRPRDSRVFNFLMLMRNFSCCGATCILPEDDDEMPSVVSRGELMRLARDASAMLGGQPQAPVEAELQHMQAPTQAARPRLRSVDDEGD